jgi:hypothetical protein
MAWLKIHKTGEKTVRKCTDMTATCGFFDLTGSGVGLGNGLERSGGWFGFQPCSSSESSCSTSAFPQRGVFLGIVQRSIFAVGDEEHVLARAPMVAILALCSCTPHSMNACPTRHSNPGRSQDTSSTTVRPLVSSSRK